MADAKPAQKVWLISNDSATIEVGMFASPRPCPSRLVARRPLGPLLTCL